ncbi:MAG: hypothetical protein AAFR52_09805 [Pseudomonadota bacterium]
MSATAEAPAALLAPPRGLVPALGGLLSRAVAVLLALHPLGAVLVLGWLMRLMRAEDGLARRRLSTAEALPRRAPLPGWLTADPGTAQGRTARLLGGLWQNLRDGLAALATLLAGTLPFTLLWLLAWWGGWENSFNKGYEQSWVGPTVALTGVALALPLLARLPMALAHQAAEGRMSAFFARRDVSRLIRAAGWRYAALMVATAIAALPLFALKGLPVFVEDWSPGFTARNEAGVEAFANVYRLLATAYLVLALIMLRRRAARLHARASLAVEAGGPRRGPVAGLGHVLRSAVLWTASFAIVAQVFVAQFVNHQWVAWLLPPLATLPWFPPLTPVP